MWFVQPAIADDFDSPILCASCEVWNQPQEPFQIWGDSWYVGVQGLSSVVIRTSEGLVLLDGGLPQSAERIEANLTKLGLNVEDIRFIATSHVHYDHVGGVAALQRHSGATVLASPANAVALANGGPTPEDPQYEGASEATFPPVVAPIRIVADQETIVLGELSLTAWFTPGHTPGGTTWTWSSCQDDKCLDLVYADSLNPVSREEFRFSDGTGEILRNSIRRIGELPCDVLVAVHPQFSDLFERVARRGTTKADPLIDPRACKAYAKSASTTLRKRLRKEKSNSL